MRGEFVYAALLDLGQREKYIATIKLDDTEADKRALFKDISIKKGSLYVGQTQISASANASLPADPDISIQQLVDLVKSDFADTELFSDKMPSKGNLRFSVAEYSEEEQRDIVDVLKPFTGSIVGLLEFANAPSNKYPEGRRKATGGSILDRFICRFSAK